MRATPRDRLLALLLSLSVRRGEFTLASGKKSDFFVDCKRTVLTPEGHALAGHVVLEALESDPSAREGLDALAAVPLGGCPLAGAAVLLSFQRGEPLELLYVRLERKDHGTGQRIEGGHRLVAPARVALVEDVVTSGGSSLAAVEALRAAGHEVVAVVALVDRLEGGRERLEAAGLALTAVFDRHDFDPPA